VILHPGVLSNCVLLGVLLLSAVGLNYAKNLDKTKKIGGLYKTPSIDHFASLTMRDNFSRKTQIKTKDNTDSSGHDVVYYLCTTDVMSLKSLVLSYSLYSSPRAWFARIFSEIFIGLGGSNDTDCFGAFSRRRMAI
jgi:hypothetical protein